MTEEITRIRAALARLKIAEKKTVAEMYDASFELRNACTFDAMTAVLARIDAQAAIRDNHAKTIEKQQAEIERLRADAARYQWLKQNGGYFALPTRPLTNDLDEAIDAAMKGSTP